MMMNWKGFGRRRSWPNFNVLSRHSPGGTEKNYEKICQGIRSSGPRFEPGTSRLRSKNVNHSTTMFDNTFHANCFLLISAEEHWLPLSRKEIITVVLQY
jgi:hypothetical protein